MICDKKVPMKMTLMPDSDSPDVAYGCETGPMSVKYEKRMATTEIRMVRWAMGVSLL